MATNKNFVVKNGLEVDGDTLFVDSTNHRVGINDSTPSYDLDVNGTVRFVGNVNLDSELIIDNNGNKGITVTGGAGDTYPHITLGGSGPQTIKFLDTSDAQGLELVYRTSPDELKIEKGSGYTLFSADRDDGSIKLYYGNSLKFETTNTGVKATGNVTLTGDAYFADNQSANFGAGNDLQIYHENTFNNSVIVESGTGNLLLGGNNIDFRDSSLTEIYATFSANGSVSLRYDNVVRFQTTSSGSSTTGVSNSDVFQSDGGSYSAASETKTDVAMVIPDETYIYTDSSGYLRNLIGKDASDNIQIGQHDTSLIIDINLRPGNNGGAVKLHHTGATDNVKLQTTGSGVSVTGTALATKLSTGATGTGINITTNTISGPSTLTLDPAGVGDNTGTVVIAGDLQVDGTTTTINSTTVTVDDLNLTLASGAANASAANGAGITIDGANASLTYVSAKDSLNFNKNVVIGNDDNGGHGSYVSSAALRVDGDAGVGLFVTNNAQSADPVAVFYKNDDGNNIPAVIISSDADAGDESILDVRGRASQSTADLSATSNSADTIFDVRGDGNVYATGDIYAGGRYGQTNYKVLTTADEGSGNGIDADTVDTLHASQFLRSDATDTATGIITFSNQVHMNRYGNTHFMEGSNYNTWITYGAAAGGVYFRTYNGTGYSTKLTLDNSGNLGIGTSPTEKLHVAGSALVTGNITNGGFDFILGNTDQSSRGDSGSSRALVKYTGNVLAINYSGDFTGGTEVQSNLTVTGNTITNGSIYCNEINDRTGQQLVLNAGEAQGKFSGQTGEYVYVNAESGLWVSTPDRSHGNFQSGYTQDSTIIQGHQITINGNTVWHEGNQGIASGLDADKLDGVEGDGYLRSNANADYYGGTLTIRSSSQSGAYQGWGIHYTNSEWRHVNNDSWGYAFRNNGASMTIKVSKEAGTTDSVATFNDYTFLGDSTGGLRIPGYLWLGGQTTRYLSEATGNFGSIQINGSGNGSWEGYSIDGRAVFMHDGSASMGLYDDVNNHWAIRHNMGNTSITEIRSGNNVNTIVCDGSNNVGIGTDNPSYKLQVEGDIKLAELGTLWFSDAAGSVEKIVGTSGELNLYADADIHFYESDSNVRRFTVDVNNGELDLGSNLDATTAQVHIDHSGNTWFNGGNVGIGTTNPTYRLTVDGSGTANTGITIAKFRNANLQDRIDIIDETGTGQLPPGILSPVAGYGLGLYAGAGPIRFYSNSTSDEKVRIDNSGNVGIGTTNPTQKLTVNGTITTTSGYVIANTGNGYIQMGPTNTSYAHMYTDLTRFYFNKRLIVDEGIVSSYDEDLLLYANNSSTLGVRVTNNAATTLYYNGNAKLATASGGIDVTGSVNATHQIRTDAFIEAGRGSGSVALTINDGHGNANIAFNHLSGIPDVTGSSGRIECAVDGSTASFSFELKNSTTAGTAVGLTQVMSMVETGVTIPGTLNVNGTTTLGAQTWNGNITWNAGKNIFVDGESSFDVRSGGSWSVWDQSTANNWIQASYGSPLYLNNNALTTIVQTSSSSDYFQVRHRTDTDISMSFYCESGTAQIADTFTDTTTDKKYIYFSNPNGSNDPGYIMHETSNLTSPDERNEGVLHLVPTDDNGYGDYVSIHGTNRPDCLKLHTDGTIETATGYTLTLSSGSNSVTIPDGNTSYGMGSLPSLILGVDGSKAGTVKLLGGTAGQYSLIQQTTSNLHLDATGNIYLAHYDDGMVYVGNTGGSGDSRLAIYKADNDVSDHLQFYVGTTRIGEIGGEDTTFLRINQETNKPIYTPRYIRADGGFFVDGTSKGINGSGNFVGGVVTSPSGGQFVRPSTLWSGTYYGVDSLGALYTEGSFRVTLSSNGYRNSSNQWTSLGANGNTGAATISLDPSGVIYFGADGSKADGSSSGVTNRATITTSGLTVTGDIGLSAELNFNGNNNKYVDFYCSTGQAAHLRVVDGSSFHTGIRIERAGEVQLYHNNSVKFQTNSGGVTSDTITLNGGHIINHNGTDSYDKIRVWDSSSYSIGMKSACLHGRLNDYAMTFTMNNESDRGFLWRDSSHDANSGAMSLSTDGGLAVSRGINVGGGEGNTGWSDHPLFIDNSWQTGQNNSYYGQYIDCDWGGTAAFTADRTQFGLRVDVDNSKSNTTTVSGNRHTIYGIHTTADSTQFTHGTYGAYNFAKTSAAGDGIGTQTVMGTYGYAQAYAANGSVNAYGGHFLSYRGGGTSGGTLYGVYGRAQNTTNGTGKSGNAYGGYFEVQNDADTISNAYGVQSVIDHNGGTTGGGCYLFRGDYQGDPQGTEWGVYINGEDKNYFSNNVGVGIDPTERLHVSGNILATGTITSVRINVGYDHGQDNSIGCSNWFRSSGNTGWYNGTHGGGWYMSDSTWIRSYGNKSIYHNSGVLRTDGTLRVGGDANGTFNAPNGGTVTINGNRVLTTADEGSFLKSGANDSFSGELYNGSLNQTPAGGNGAIQLQPSASGGSTGIFFNSRVNASSDGAYIWWYDDNNNYRKNDSAENGALVIGVQNDGNATSEDAIAIESSGDIFLNPGNDGGFGNAGGATGPDFNEGKVYIGRAATKYEVYHTGNLSPLTTSTTFGGDVSGTYNAIVVANDSHTHDGRYYTETESNARFLGISAKAADSNLLDGIDSTGFLQNYHETAINSPNATSGSWTTANSSSWGDPKFNNTYDQYRFADGSAYVQYNVPSGYNSCWISQLQWSSGGYADCYGVQSDGGLVFLRRINTRQGVENTNEGNPDQHDGSTITHVGSGLDHFTAIRIQNRTGRIHLTGIAWTKNDNSGYEGTGMVHPAQISHQGSGSGLDADKLDGAQPSVSASNSTIVQRHSSGYIYANYFNTTPNDVSSGVTKVLVETGNDGFMRHGTAAAIRGFIGAGSGNGLDADTVDGIQGESFLRSDAADTATGALTFSGGLALTNGPGTIAGATFNNGWLRIGSSSLGWAFDSNEMVTFGSCIINSASGSTLTFENRPAFNGGTSGSSSPFTVDSTQVVTNLNADLLDGLQSTNFLRSNANNDSATGTFRTSAAYIEAGKGSGSVALTVNDGQGNANIAFNHLGGVPDVNGSSGRIECSVDSTTANMYFELGNSSTANTSKTLSTIMTLTTSAITAGAGISFSGDGSGLTNLNAANLTGTISDARIPDTITPATLVQTKEIRTSNGTEIVINAGESAGKIGSQTGEVVYVNAEGGLRVCTPSVSNWGTGYVEQRTNITGSGIYFHNNTTAMGEITTQDTTWLRINQNTAKNIYTPRYIRADGGFFVDGTSRGIDGSGNFLAGTISANGNVDINSGNIRFQRTGTVSIYQDDNSTNSINWIEFQGSTSGFRLGGNDFRFYTGSSTTAIGTNNVTINSSGIYISGANALNALQLTGTSPTISLHDTDADSFFLHVNSNNFYILCDRDGTTGAYNSWETPHPLQLEGDTNIGYLFGSRIFADNYHPNADKWTTARTLSLSGNASGSVSWDGSGNATLSVTVSQSANADTLDGKHRPNNFGNSSGQSSYITNANLDTGYNVVGASVFYPAGGASVTGDPTDNHIGQGYLFTMGMGDNGGRGAQITASSGNNQEFYFRTKADSGYQSWRKVWHDGNDGPNTGLYADISYRNEILYEPTNAAHIPVVGSATVWDAHTSNYTARLTRGPGRFSFNRNGGGVVIGGNLHAQGVYNSTNGTNALVRVNTDGQLRRDSSSRKFKTNIEDIEYSYTENFIDNSRPVWFQALIPDPEYPQEYLDSLSEDSEPNIEDCHNFVIGYNFQGGNIEWDYKSKCHNEGVNPNYGWWGFIAEELSEVDPRLVVFDEKEGPIAINYDRAIPHIVMELKKKRQEVKDLQELVGNLVSRIEVLESSNT